MKGEHEKGGKVGEDQWSQRSEPQKTKGVSYNQKWPEGLFSQLISALPVGVYVVQDGRFQIVSSRFQAITGYSDKELLGMPCLQIVHPQDRAAVRDRAVSMLKSGQCIPYEFRILTKQGKIRWIMESVVSIDLKGRKATLGNFMDITERKRAQEALEQREALLNAVLSSSPLGVALVEVGIIQWTNEAMVELLRCNRPIDLVGKNVQDFFVSGEDYRRIEEEIYAGFRKGRRSELDLRLKRFDGTVFDAHLKVAPFEIKEKGEMFVATISDVSWRKEAERTLAKEKERLAVTLSSIGDGVISTDRNGAIGLVNKTAEELTGWEEGKAVGKSLDEVFYVINEGTGEPYGNLVKKVLQGRAIVNLPAGTLLISKDKQRRPIEGSLSPIYVNQSEILGSVIVFRDLSERRRLEEELMRMQKLEAIGVMAGGIAHDFNNLLMGIVGYITLARMNIEQRDETLRCLEEAKKACMRAKELAQKLVVFSKGGEPVRETVSMAKLLKDSISLCTSGSNVKAEFSLPEDLWQVHVDEGQIAQVIHNIVQNALESMGEGGAIFVKGENVQIPPGESIPIDPGPYVKITIQDHGPGIPSEHMAKIFDPFYTTKEMGRGLGLSICHSIVKKHGGHIQVHSRPGCGTEVSLYLPALEAGETRPADESFTPSSFGIRVLLMDDEEVVRETTRQILTHFGCDVDCAAEGGEAIDLYKKAKQWGRPYDVVILDLTVPGGMGGKETAVELLKVDPEVKMIVSSGYANDPVMSQFRQYGFKAAIAKPYNMDELIEVMRDLTSGDSV